MPEFAQSPAYIPQESQREQVLTWLSHHVSSPRVQHILRVETMATELAAHYRLNVNQAGQAALMHDLAKFFPSEHLLQVAQAEQLPLDSVDYANPHLLHAEVGAVVARDEFGVQDEEVLAAIRNHTLGKPGMSLLSCVVFLADSLEPGRGSSPELDALRTACWQNLHRAVYLTCDFSLKTLMATRRLIHPRAILTRNWAMQLASKTPIRT